MWRRDPGSVRRPGRRVGSAPSARGDPPARREGRTRHDDRTAHRSTACRRRDVLPVHASTRYAAHCAAPSQTRHRVRWTRRFPKRSSSPMPDTCTALRSRPARTPGSRPHTTRSVGSCSSARVTGSRFAAWRCRASTRSRRPSGSFPSMPQPGRVRSISQWCTSMTGRTRSSTASRCSCRSCRRFSTISRCCRCRSGTHPTRTSPRFSTAAGEARTRWW